MKKQVLLLYPEIPATYWSLKNSLSFINKKASIPPLGILTVAAMFPANYDLTLIDMNVTTLTEEDIIKADIVFISAMIIQKNSFEQITALCKKHNRKVVAGGPYPSSSYQSIQDIDHFILNECEDIFSEFIHDYEKDQLKKIYTTTEKPDINCTPIPRFDLLNMNDYSVMALQFSRGCHFNCEFCDIIEMFGRKPRTKQSANFIRELDAVYKSGFRGSIFIVDDNFIGNKKRVKELLTAIIDWQKEKHYPFTFFTEASINLADDEGLLDLMVKSAFDMVFIGIETPDEETLLSVKKNQNMKLNLLEAVHQIQKKGIEVSGGFIVGFDTDKNEVFDNQIQFIKEASIPMAMVGLLEALPNTQLYRRLKRENRLLSDSSGNNTHNLRLNYLPKMDTDTLMKGYKKIISNIYKPKNYFDRCYLLLKRMPANSLQFGLKPEHIKALFMSLSKQTFSSYGLQYLKFLFKILFTGINHFPKAISFAVKGYHFFKITNDILYADEFFSKVKEAIASIELWLNEVVKEDMPDEIQQLDLKIQKLYTYLQKNYNKLSQDMQEYQSDAFNHFKKYCEIANLRLKNAFNNHNNSMPVKSN